MTSHDAGLSGDYWLSLLSGTPNSVIIGQILDARAINPIPDVGLNSVAMKAGKNVLDVALKSDNHDRRSELESRHDSTKKRPPPRIKPKQ